MFGTNLSTDQAKHSNSCTRYVDANVFVLDGKKPHGWLPTLKKQTKRMFLAQYMYVTLIYTARNTLFLLASLNWSFKEESKCKMFCYKRHVTETEHSVDTNLSIHWLLCKLHTKYVSKLLWPLWRYSTVIISLPVWQ